MNILLRFTYNRSFLLVILLLILIAAATTPLYASTYYLLLMSGIFMYVILSVSWFLFSGPTGYISLAPAAFLGIGIYCMAIMGKTFPLLVTVAFSGLITSIIAIGVGALSLRLKGIYFAMMTFGLVILFQQLILFRDVITTGMRGRFVITVDDTIVYYIMLAILVLLIITAYFIRRSKYGLALKCIGENEEAASHSGINVNMVKIVTFSVSAFFMGAAGAIIATRWTYVDPYSAFNYPYYSFLPILMAIFGGMGQLFGPVIGAAIIALLQEILITEFPYYYMLIFGIVLLIVILFLPEGITGLIQRLRRRKLGRPDAAS